MVRPGPRQARSKRSPVRGGSVPRGSEASRAERPPVGRSQDPGAYYGAGSWAPSRRRLRRRAGRDYDQGRDQEAGRGVGRMTRPWQALAAEDPHGLGFEDGAARAPSLMTTRDAAGATG